MVVDALVARNVAHAYPTAFGAVAVLREINLALAGGQVLAIQGPSGAGKSTLLHVLGGLEEPSQGEVLWQGKALGGLSQDERAKRRAAEVGFVFQHHYLLEDLTALENVALPGEIAGKDLGSRPNALLERVGVAHRAGFFPRTLSGGERQRVALARALATKPRLVLADEPTGSLDRANALAVFDLLLGLAHEEGTTVVVVTHDEALAARADVRMRLNDGVLEQQV